MVFGVVSAKYYYIDPTFMVIYSRLKKTNKQTNVRWLGVKTKSTFGFFRFRSVQNPGYMKENFVICIESLHIGDVGNQTNVSAK